MNLEAYVDESGTHDPKGSQPGSEVAAVVGYVSWKDDWKTFCEQRADVLKHYHVSVFHMAEFNKNEINGRKDPKWPYRGWSNEKKDRFIRELASVAVQNALFGAGGLVSVRDYDRIIPDKLKAEAVHPYHFCFQLFFDTVLETLRNRFDVPFPPEVKVRFYFDRQQQFKEKATQLFNQVRSLRDPENRMATIQFVSKEKHIPIQAADLLAFRMRKVLTRKLKGKRPINTGSWDEELAARGNLVMSYYDAENLRTLAANVARGKQGPSGKHIVDDPKGQ